MSELICFNPFASAFIKTGVISPFPESTAILILILLYLKKVIIESRYSGCDVYLLITSSLHSQFTTGYSLMALATALITISLTEILTSGNAFSSCLILCGRHADKRCDEPRHILQHSRHVNIISFVVMGN